MGMKNYSPHRGLLVPFDRDFFSSDHRFTYIGRGELGGKAHGLAEMKGIIDSELGGRFAPDLNAYIPTLTVITTEYFDLFMKENDLYSIAYSDKRDDLIAHAFQRAHLPVRLVGDLRALVHEVHTPLAVRSSSMLEDAMFEPFASVYGTKMIPNNQPGVDKRFSKLVEAVKYVYASTFFGAARNYMKATHHTTRDEKMAVIIQEVVGSKFGERFYPNISGVVRSYNFYPTGNASPEDGVADLALGLGRTIVDEGMAWSYSPAYPKAGAPFNSINDMLKNTQTEFWAVNMKGPAAYDPLNETEYMNKYDLTDGEYDGTLKNIASTLDSQDGKIVMGTGRKGPRIIDFAPILKAGIIPLNDLLKTLLKACEDSLGVMVEIEFAVRMDIKRGKPAEFGFLQIRPMVVSESTVELDENEMRGEKVLLSSETVLGNGTIDSIRDIVYVDPEKFDVRKTEKIAEEMDALNRSLVKAGREYILVGFGRWGTSDPSGGIPVKFDQISGAKVIVEASLPGLSFPLSQGSHFFHNVTSFKIFYFSLEHREESGIDWEWLRNNNIIEETEHLKHVETSSPLRVKVDGRKSMGVVLHG
ncbi:MAG: PEP/pyruvate-binding domain-containing protein [Candidatus Krumholzibacteriota bacterium]|nr:PEP/pyruvate-binding domain-containing protein [Candidatus Krumholzibacteriota bacterium]